VKKKLDEREKNRGAVGQVLGLAGITGRTKMLRPEACLGATDRCKALILRGLIGAKFGPRFAMPYRMNIMAPEKKSRGDEQMSLAYDLFERLPDGQPMWVEAVASIDDALTLIGNLAASRGRSPKDFFVYDVRQGAMVAVPKA